jgi:replicative DNA helicase
MNKIIPPNNIESEKIVLGSMIADNEKIPDMLAIVKQKYFFNKDHEIIFGLIKRLYESNTPVDSVSLYEASKSHNLTVDAALLSDISCHSSILSNSKYHCCVITEKFMLRELIRKSTEINNYAYRQEEDVFDLISGSIADLERTLEIQDEIKEERNLNDKLEDIFSSINDEREGKIEPSLKTFAHPTFNRCTGGIRPGNIVAISGKYKQGKTTFVASLISDFAIQKKKKIGWFSLEVNEYEMDLKFISMNTNTRYGYLRDPANKTRDGNLRYGDESLSETAASAMRKFHDTKIFVNDTDLDISRIINKLKLWKKKHSIDIAVIDYIGLIENSGKSERRDLEIAELSRKLKRAAGTLGIPIFVLSQENEDGKTADSKALLRDADFWFSISNLADRGSTIWKIEDNEGRWEVPVDPSYFEVKNKGNRHGLAGTRILYHYNENGSFCEVDYKNHNKN